MSGQALPAVPECIDVSSVTPDSVKSPTPPPVASNAAPDAETAATTDTDPAAAADDRAGSPPPSCPICLGTYKNKCFTDSCLHQFCFNCLLEWSKIKAECPLCKQSFKSIIHNVKSEREFEEYLVQQPLHYNLMLSEPYRFSYSTTLQVRPSQSEALQRLFLHHPSLTDRYVYPRNETPNVRRRIYERGLYALPLLDITGRARECSAEFYRSNQAQVHRLIPFLNREAIHVIQDPRRVSSLLQRATEVLTTHDITSADFRRLMEPYFRENTVHFIHEFYNFARSPYDLYGYDNNVQYSQDYNLAMQSTNAATGQQHQQQQNNNQSSSTRSLRSNAGGSRTGGGASSSAGPSGSSSSAPWLFASIHNNTNNDTVVNVLSSSSSSDTDEDNNSRPTTSNNNPTNNNAATATTAPVSVIQTNPTAGTSSGITAGSSSTQIKTEQQRVESVIRTAGEPSVKIELSDTDSDECQFVLERKPPHLRTPEYVSLNSDEDSDVVFVNQSTEEVVLPRQSNSNNNTNSNNSNPAFPGQSNNNSSSNTLQATNLSLMDDSSHMPMFMPYMYGMDQAEPGPSTSTGARSHMAGVGGGKPQMFESKPPPSHLELKFKYEDPMLCGRMPMYSSSTSVPRRKKRNQRQRKQAQQLKLQKMSQQQQQQSNHHQLLLQGTGLGWSSSEDEEEEDEDDVSQGGQEGPSGTTRKRRSNNSNPPATYSMSTSSGTSGTSESSSSTSSSNGDSEFRISPRTKAIAKNARKVRKTAVELARQQRQNRRRNEKRKEAKREGKLMGQGKRFKGSDLSPVAGDAELRMREGNSEEEHSSSEDEEINVKDVSGEQPVPVEEEVVVNPRTEEVPMDLRTTEESCSRSEVGNVPVEEDNASNEGSIATSASSEATTTMGSANGMGDESEEIDVQNNDDEDNDFDD